MAKRFGTWLSAQKDRNDPVGDLARDYLAPCSDNGGRASCARHSWSEDGVLTHMEIHGAHPDAIRAYEAAVKEWKAAA